MTINEAIQEFEDNAYHHSKHPVVSDEAMTVALKAMSEKSQREQGCEFCTIFSDKRKVLGYNGANDAISVSFGDGAFIDSDSWEIRIVYCPMCGRKLDGGEEHG